MQLQVESRSGLHGDKEPVAFMLGNARIDVVEIVDRWMGCDYSYFKIRASDHATYILRYEPLDDEWQLTMFKARI